MKRLAYIAVGSVVVVLAVGMARSSRASAVDEDVALDVLDDGEGCRAVTSRDGSDVLCAGAGKTVVGLRPHPAGIACPSGGRAISWGSDVNGNAMLEPSELEGSTYVCAHARRGVGRNAMVARTSLALRNGHCPAGGSLVQSGIDRDGDGRLSANEVERATFACNRFGGASLEATVAVEDEAPGGRCALGGKRISVGHEDETPRVSWVCNGR